MCDAASELVEQRRLADAGLAADDHAPQTGSVGAVELVLEHPQLRDATHECKLAGPGDREGTVAVRQSNPRPVGVGLDAVPTGRDPSLDRDELGGWLRAHLFGEERPVRLERAQRLGPASGTGQRADQQTTGSIAQRVRRDPAFEPRHGLGRAAPRDQLGAVVVTRGRVFLGEPRGLPVGPGLAAELVQRRAGPVVERGGERGEAIRGVPRLRHRARAPVRVHFGVEAVSGARGADDIGPEGGAEPGDQLAERPRRDVHDIGEPFAPDGVGGLQREQGKEPPLTRAGKLDRSSPVGDGVHGAEDPYALDAGRRVVHRTIVTRAPAPSRAGSSPLPDASLGPRRSCALVSRSWSSRT